MILTLSILIVSGCAATRARLQPVYVLEGDHVIRLVPGDRVIRATGEELEIRREGAFCSYLWLEKTRLLELKE